MFHNFLIAVWKYGDIYSIRLYIAAVVWAYHILKKIQTYIHALTQIELANFDPPVQKSLNHMCYHHLQNKSLHSCHLYNSALSI